MVHIVLTLLYVGWLGYGEEKMKSLLKETIAQGYRHFKMKVGGNLEDDKRRLRIAREAIGYDQGNILMVDANQVCAILCTEPIVRQLIREMIDMVRPRGY